MTKTDKFTQDLDSAYSEQFAEIAAHENTSVVYVQTERLCAQMLLNLLAIHGYKKTRSQLAKLSRKLNKRSKGTSND